MGKGPKTDLTREMLHHAGPGPVSPCSGAARSVLERLPGPPVNTLIKWGNGSQERGRDSGTASENGTKLSAVRSGCRSSEVCRGCSSPAFSLKTKDKPLGKRKRPHS